MKTVMEMARMWGVWIIIRSMPTIICEDLIHTDNDKASKDASCIGPFCRIRFYIIGKLMGLVQLKLKQ